MKQEKTRSADWAQRVVSLFMMQQYLKTAGEAWKETSERGILGFLWEIQKWVGGVMALEGLNSWGWEKEEEIKKPRSKSRKKWGVWGPHLWQCTLWAWFGACKWPVNHIMGSAWPNDIMWEKQKLVKVYRAYGVALQVKPLERRTIYVCEAVHVCGL